MKIQASVDERFLLEIEQELKKKFPNYKIELTKDVETIDVFNSIRPEINFVDISIIVASLIAVESGKALCKKATEDLYDFIKEKFNKKVVKSIEVHEDEEK